MLIIGMFLLFLVGFVSFLTPTGPITILIFRNSMIGKYGRAFMITIGAGIVQLFFCAISLIIINEIISERLLFFSRLLSAIIFFILGIYLFISKTRKSREIITLKDLPGKEKLQAFLVGFLITFFNPGIILSWLAIIVLFMSFNLIAITSYIDILTLSIASLIGICAGGFFMMFIVHKNKDLFSDKSIKLLMKILGFIIMIIAFYLLYSALFL